MARTITIVEGESLTYNPDNGESTTILSKWVCDKHQDRVLIKSAFAEPIILGGADKISATNPITINDIVVTDPTVAQAAIKANW